MTFRPQILSPVFIFFIKAPRVLESPFFQSIDLLPVYPFLARLNSAVFVSQIPDNEIVTQGSGSVNVPTCAHSILSALWELLFVQFAPSCESFSSVCFETFPPAFSGRSLPKSPFPGNHGASPETEVFGCLVNSLFFRFLLVIIKTGFPVCLVMFHKISHGNGRGFLQMVTINDIAARLGVSKSTVSKGLNQFGHDIVLGFKQMAEPDGWTVDVVPMDKDFQRNIPYSVFMMQNGYRGGFILGFSLIDPWMSEFKSCKIPTVLYDNYISTNPRVASVGCDSQDGFDQAVKHLVKLGHEKIGLISGPLESYIVKARYNAYINALSKFNLELNDNYIGLGYYISDSTRDNVQRMYELGVTAIICSHDIRAISAITECMDKGIRIPEDMSIIGFDDLPMTAYTEPPLTTVRQDRTALGKAGYYAMSCLQNELPICSILLRAPLVVRSSTGPARTA